LKMEPTQGSETSAYQNLTPGRYPKEYTQYSTHGESLKSSMAHLVSSSTALAFLTNVSENRQSTSPSAIPVKNH
jgi:hypothetical protein